MAPNEEVQSLFGQFKEANSRLKEAKKIYDFIKEKVINAFDGAEKKIREMTNVK